MIRKEKLDELRSYIEELKTIKVLEDREINKDEKSFLTIKRRKCLLNNGEIIDREQILKGKRNGSASVVLPVTKNGNVLLIVQPRVFTDNTVCVEFPAGYIEENEDPVLAGMRELIEETGYIPDEMKYLCRYYQDQGCSSAYNYNYLGLGCEKKENQNLDKDEFIRYFECTYDEVLELADMGYINDINSLFVLEKSKQYKSLIKGRK